MIGVTAKVGANKAKVSIRDSIKVSIEVSKASKAKVGASKETNSSLKK